MIDGFKLRISSAELKQHCKARAAYHSRRAEEKQVSLPELKRTMETIKGAGMALSVATMNKGGYSLDANDAVESLEKDINDHRNKAEVFNFYADHLFDDDYNLGDGDLIRLEILKR
jgi:phage tail tube protein FII